MGVDREIDPKSLPEGLLLYARPGVNLKIIFEKEYKPIDYSDPLAFDKVTAIPGTAFIVVSDEKLIPWKDYPLILELSDCIVPPFNLCELYEKTAGV